MTIWPIYPAPVRQQRERVKDGMDRDYCNLRGDILASLKVVCACDNVCSGVNQLCILCTVLQEDTFELGDVFDGQQGLEMEKNAGKECRHCIEPPPRTWLTSLGQGGVLGLLWVCVQEWKRIKPQFKKHDICVVGVWGRHLGRCWKDGCVVPLDLAFPCLPLPLPASESPPPLPFPSLLCTAGHHLPLNGNQSAGDD